MGRNKIYKYLVVWTTLLLVFSVISIGMMNTTQSTELAKTSEENPSTEKVQLTSNSISKEVEIGPGEDHVVQFDEESGEFVTEPVKGPSDHLNGNASDAIDKAPAWLEDKLTTSFTKLMKEGLNVGSHSNPAMGDLNGDGMADLLVGNADGKIYKYTNVGTETAPMWREDGAIQEIDVEGPANPTLGDLTGNGELDLVVGNGNGTLNFFTMIGEQWEQVDRIVEDIDVGNNSAPFLFDLRGDGLLDLIVGSESGTVHYYENVGADDSPDWKEKTHMFPVWKEFGVTEGVWPSTNSTPSLAERNGELFLYIGNGEGEVYRFKNTVMEENHASWENLGTIANLDVGSYASPELCDIDSDGRHDLILGSEDGAVRHIKNHGTPSRPEYPIMDHDAEDLPLGKLGWGPSYYPEVEKFTTVDLTSEYVDHYADMIMNTEEPYLDEVVYQIANDKITQLRSMKDNNVSHLYLKNAETIYEMSENLTYVDVVEMDGYSTLEYNMENGTEIVPRENYYKYTLMYNRYTLSPEDWPERTEGNFYRSYLPYDDTYNVTLFEKVHNASTAHEAAYNISYWLQEDIGAWWHTGPKPSGWYNIYHQLTNESAGIWCGEFAIIWQVASRSVLIPSLNIVALGEDHQFNNFWYNGSWHHVDSSTGIDEFDADRGLAYWYKEGYSHPMKWAENGRYDPVERAPVAYTPEDEEATVEVKVRDAEGNPVDGARVELWSHAVIEAYGVPLPTGITMTDSHGEAKFDPVGFNKIGKFEENNFSVVATSRIGSQRTEVVITEDRTYTLEIMLDDTIPGLQEAKSEEVANPAYNTDVEVNVDSGYQDAPCWLMGMHETTWQYEEGMAIDAYVLTEDQYQDYRLGRDFSALAMLEDVDSGSLSEVLFNDDIYLVLSNRDSLTTTKTVELSMSVEPLGVDTVVVSPEESQVIEAGETIDFSAEAYNEYGNLITDNDSDFAWEHTDETGLFYKTEAGEYAVTATYQGVSS
ncbi:MAG: FG-GAP-like repeat-containing protein, partial [Candidatus Thermoplasmatota archaeon]